jgi:Flp pilus assembly protein protease CpaA
MTEAAVVTLLTLAAWTDWRYRRVSNMLVFPFMTAGLLFQASMGEGWLALAGMGAAFALTFLPVLFRGMGMGDQKLLMAVGAWTSYTEVYTIFLYSLCTCLLALLCSPKKWRILAQNMNILTAGWVGHRTVWFPQPGKSALSLPYAVHLLLAYIVVRSAEAI